MATAGLAITRQFRRGVFTCIFTAAAVTAGCAKGPPATADAPEPQQALRREEPAAPPPAPPPAVAAGDVKPPGSDAEVAKAREEAARATSALKASQAEAVKLRQELKAAQTNLRGWHNAYKAVQAQAA